MTSCVCVCVLFAGSCFQVPSASVPQDLYQSLCFLAGWAVLRENEHYAAQLSRLGRWELPDPSPGRSDPERDPEPNSRKNHHRSPTKNLLDSRRPLPVDGWADVRPGTEG